MNPRALAAKTITSVTAEGRSLSAALPAAFREAAPGDRPLVQELCYGVLRWYPRLDALAAQLLRKPLKARDADVGNLLLTGLYQLLFLNMPPHAAVHETVEAVRFLNKDWAAGLVNAVLRGFLRGRERLLALVDRREGVALAHPEWLYALLRADWPDDYRALMTANNQRPPMTLRVNAARTTRDAYLQVLADAGIAARPACYAEQGVVLESPMDVERLPGFAEGVVSVQDAAAQMAAALLGAERGMRVLDACAAPGGKTAHILELEPALDMVALDIDQGRLLRVAENLQRSGVRARLIHGDARMPQEWWDGTPFDRILVDAPCSATGVIRRHPDIKVLRKKGDIPVLAEQQGAILDALWPLLAPGGRLLYVTCSVLRAENEWQIGAFLARHDDAREKRIPAFWGTTCTHGRQVLPGEEGMDGFFFASIEKHLAA